MSFWTLVGISAVATATSGPLTLTLPASLQAGDLLVACITWRDSPTFTLPATGGWSNAGISPTTANNGNNVTTAISGTRLDYLVRGGADPSGTDLIWERTLGNNARGYILAYRPAANTVATFDAAATGTLGLGLGSTAFSMAGLTTAEDNEILIMAAGLARAAATTNQVSAEAAATDPLAAAWTEHADTGTTTTNTAALGVASALKLEKGATGNFTYTAAASARHSAVVGAFRAAKNLYAAPATGILLDGHVLNPGVDAVRTDRDFDVGFTGSNVKTFTGFDIGVAQADRLVFIHASFVTSDVTAINSMTIGGISATRACTITDPDGALNSEWWYAAVPTGTTASVAITFNATETVGLPIVIDGYRAYGADTSNPIYDFETATTNASLTISDTIDVQTNGMILAAAFGEVGDSPTYTWTGVNEDIDASFAATYGWSVGSYWAAAADTGRTIQAVAADASPAAFNKNLVIVAIRLASVTAKPSFFGQIIG